MKRLLVVLAVLVGSSLALTTATAPANTVRKCVYNKLAGIEVINKVTLITYCGSAKTTFHSQGKTTNWKGGACLKPPSALIVGFGKFTNISHDPISDAFYFVIPLSGDGASRLAVLTVQHKGQTTKIANNVKVVVKGGRSRGTYSGQFLNGPKFTGSFTCK